MKNLMNLRKRVKMMNLRKVDYYYETAYPEDELNLTYLQRIFYDGTQVSGDPFFSQIWTPVRIVDGSGIAENPTYIQCGFTINEIAKLYYTYYRGMYLTGKKTPQENSALIMTMIESVLHDNYPKYLKLLEMNGLEYNPLWNVDGTEVRQRLENQGVNDVTTGPTASGITTSHDVSAYDSATKREWIDTTLGKTETTYTHNNAHNTHNGEPEEYSVLAKDTAFGYDLVGGDKMHVEKLIRQGNIGVTKTTELIRDQRDIVKWSLMREFFNDINKVILVEIFN